MADGSRARPQSGFNFPERALTSALRAGEIVVDLFAGGGGASEALRQALGRDPDICINHDEWAIGMHAANHPFARHLCEDVWHADPRRECASRHVGWLHASPDCTHFSQAKGGQPRSRATRSLSWVVLKWAGAVRPRIISLENVEQILKWGPLIAKRDRATGRVVTLDEIPDPSPEAKPGDWIYRVADARERVPVDNQHLIPDKRHEGRTWGHFVAALRSLGYAVEWRKVKACDHGAGTSRTRLFMVARCDGEAIRWPQPTHGPGRAQPYVTAADCIDWSIECPSIFTRKKPLAEATLRRIARGVKRYVIDAAEPFFLTEFANASRGATWSADEPLRTQCANVKGGHFALAAAALVPRYGEREGQEPRALAADEPMPTIVPTGNGAGIVMAYLEQAAGGPNSNPSRPRDMREPVSTIVGKGSQQQLVTAHMAKLRGTSHCADVADPLHTISAGGEHHAVVECTLSPEAEAGALRVAAFLVNYYGNGQPLDCRDPLDTVTTRDRLALVTVTIKGTPYVIVDIGLRMLRPPELYRAQGFPADYIIDRTADGRPITGTRAVKMVGNSVSPPPLCAIARANLDHTHVDARCAA